MGLGFVLEGLLTLCVSFFGLWLVHDSPATAKFLSEHEKAEVQRRLAADDKDLFDSFHLRYVKQALKDWKIWVNMLITCGLFSGLFPWLCSYQPSSRTWDTPTTLLSL